MGDVLLLLFRDTDCLAKVPVPALGHLLGREPKESLTKQKLLLFTQQDRQHSPSQGEPIVERFSSHCNSCALKSRCLGGGRSRRNMHDIIIIYIYLFTYLDFFPTVKKGQAQLPVIFQIIENTIE